MVNTKYTLILSIGLVLLSNVIFAQERYKEIIFKFVEVSTHEYAYKDGESLRVDFYSPAEDTCSARPLLLFVHGGGFAGGQRDEPQIAAFCTNIAMKGYAVASMSYRLTRKNKSTGFGCNCPAIDKQNTFEMVNEDIYDCIYHLLKNNKTFKLNSHKIVLSGSSAGAEAVLNVAYQPPILFNLLSEPLKFSGVISFAGAMQEINLVNTESAIPAMFFHGTCDNLVPYATASHHYCKEDEPGYLTLYGAYTITQRYEELNKPYWLYTLCHGGHEMAGVPLEKHQDIIHQFLYQYIILNKGEQKHEIEASNNTNCQLEKYNFCR